jgi:hypothetical protein
MQQDEQKEIKEITPEMLKDASQFIAGRTFLVRLAEDSDMTFIRVYDGQLHFLTEHTMACISDHAANGHGAECSCEPVPAFALGPTLVDHQIATSMILGLLNMGIKAVGAKDRMQRRVNRFLGRG